MLDRLGALLDGLERAAFVQSWLYEGSPHDDHLVAAAERYFERAVNALVELFDIVEKEAVRNQRVPPPLPDTAKKAALQARFDDCRDAASSSVTGPTPSRPGAGAGSDLRPVATQ